MSYLNIPMAHFDLLVFRGRVHEYDTQRDMISSLIRSQDRTLILYQKRSHITPRKLSYSEDMGTKSACVCIAACHEKRCKKNDD